MITSLAFIPLSSGVASAIHCDINAVQGPNSLTTGESGTFKTDTHTVSCDESVNVTWKVDGVEEKTEKNIDRTSQFIFEPDSPGTYDVVANIQHGEATRWRVEVTNPVEIEPVAPTSDLVSDKIGDRRRFAVTVTGPADKEDVVWEVNGDQLDGYDGGMLLFEAVEEVRAGETSDEGYVRINDKVEFEEGEYTIVASVPGEEASYRWDYIVSEPPDFEIRPTGMTVGEVKAIGPENIDWNGGAGTVTIEIGNETFTDTPEVSRSFDTPQVVDITVTVTNGEGVSLTKTAGVVVENDEPAVELLEPANPEEAYGTTKRGETYVFYAALSDEDAAQNTLELQFGEQVVDTATFNGSQQRVRLEGEFQTLGPRTVQIVGKDGLGGRDSVGFETEVRSPRPEFTQLRTDAADLGSVFSGVPVRFEAAAEDPEGETVTLSWYLNGELISPNQPANSTETIEFPQSGSYNVTVLAEDVHGMTRSHSWDVSVQSFATEPDVSVSRTEITEENAYRISLDFSKLSQQRRVGASFRVEFPDDIIVSRIDEGMTRQSGSAGTTFFQENISQKNIGFTVEPGEGLEPGETATLNFSAFYRPMEAPEDTTVVEENKRIVVSIDESGEISVGNDGDNGENADTETEQQTETQSDDGFGSGFGPMLGLAGLGSVVIILVTLRSRRTD
jgi:hypothetical protein